MPRYFFFNDTATTEIYTLSLHDALPIWDALCKKAGRQPVHPTASLGPRLQTSDRKSTRLNSSHANISYAVFCLKKKKNTISAFSSPWLSTIVSYPSSIITSTYLTHAYVA